MVLHFGNATSPKLILEFGLRGLSGRRAGSRCDIPYHFTTAALTGVSPTGIMVNSEALL